MARYLGPTCKLARREGTDLFLKSPVRPLDSKCRIDKLPGQTGTGRRPRVTVYGVQLREKQKLRRMYGVMEKQFRNYYKKSARRKGSTGENLIRMLEGRLDNVVYRLGMAATRSQARQIVNHGHVRINGRKVNIASCIVKENDEITIKEKDSSRKLVTELITGNINRQIPEWLALSKVDMAGKVNRLPEKADIPPVGDEQLVVEFYSK